MSQNQHYIIHIITIAVIVWLTTIILNTPEPSKVDNDLVTHLEQENASVRLKRELLMKRSDSLYLLLDSLESIEPEIKIKYIERNEEINQINDSNLLDSVHAVLARFRPEN
jgi:hypothetical protein